MILRDTSARMLLIHLLKRRKGNRRDFLARASDEYETYMPQPYLFLCELDLSKVTLSSNYYSGA